MLAYSPGPIDMLILIVIIGALLVKYGSQLISKIYNTLRNDFGNK